MRTSQFAPGGGAEIDVHQIAPIWDVSHVGHRALPDFLAHAFPKFPFAVAVLRFEPGHEL